MKRTTKLAVAIGAGGALLIGGTAATTALVVNGLDDRPTQTRLSSSHGPMGGGDQMDPGWDRQGRQDQGRMGQGRHNGMGQGGGPIAPTAQKGSLTAEQKTVLASMAEEEKLAHDLYAAFADRYDMRVFDNIAASESRHLQAVRTLLDRYDLTDPTAGKEAGSFGGSTFQATYDKLLAQGGKSEQDALKAGRQVEQTDIADLTKALNGLTAPDVRQVYDHLLTASQHHLNAFERWITN